MSCWRLAVVAALAAVILLPGDTSVGRWSDLRPHLS